MWPKNFFELHGGASMFRDCLMLLTCVQTILTTGHQQWTALQVTSVLWSPDAARLVSAALDCTARVWQLTSHGDGFTCEAILRLHTGRITCMQFCADAKQLITGTSNIQLVPCFARLPLLPIPPTPISFFTCPVPCQALVLPAGSQDASVRVWNCSDWQCARYLQGTHSIKVKRMHSDACIPWLCSEHHLTQDSAKHSG